MNFDTLLRVFTDNGCTNVYVKKLAPNDNSKNQVYLAGDFEVLNIFPIGEIIEEEVGSNKRERSKARLPFYWVNNEGSLVFAPEAKLILYPKYPEVRFSGFLTGCKNAPSALMNSRDAGRILFLSIDSKGNTLGYVSAVDDECAIAFNKLSGLETEGVFLTFSIQKNRIQTDTRSQLLKKLKQIHLRGWIDSRRLNAAGNLIPCTAPQCGGYTLEAELGITPNGYSEPDYLGWEIKQFHVKNFIRLNSSVITLMTPEPTGGFYVTDGTEAFIRRFGYPDKMGRADRMNFGGIHKTGITHAQTELTIVLDGFDHENGSITAADGKIVLVTRNGFEAASWSFNSLLKHWNRKHAKACYVPSLSKKVPSMQYQYGQNVILGTGTDFRFFLNEMAFGRIYYDPGIKLENISTIPKVKKRSQFRINSGFLKNLYQRNELVDLLND